MSSTINKLPTVRKVIKTNVKWFDLYVLGDIHVGHENCDEEAAKKTINYIAKKDKRTSGVILTGDLIENVVAGSKGSFFEMKYPSPAQQREVVVEMLKPIKDHILIMCDGNHEDRTQRSTGVSLSKEMAKDLGVPYVGYHGMLQLTLQHGDKKQNYSIYAEHGTGSVPKGVGARYGKLESIQKMVDTDIYIKGHIHHKCAFSKRVWKNIDGKMTKRKLMFASNGSYLQDAEYAIRSGFEPTEPGVAKLLLSSSDFNIHCSI